MLPDIYSRTRTRFLKMITKYMKTYEKNNMFSYENMKIYEKILKCYLNSSKIYKTYTNPQEELNIIQIQCLHSGT